MIGKYTIFIDGLKVLESPNLITDSGRITILRYLASISSVYAGALAIGISDAGPTVDDKELGYEVSSEIINLRSVDYDNSEILFKATFPVGERIVVKEIGMFPENSIARSNMVYYFDDSEDWDIVEVRNLTDIRLGESGIENTALSGGTETTTLDARQNFAEMLLTDKFCLAFLTYDDNCEYIRIQFTDINGDQMYSDFVPAAHTEDPGNPQYQIIENTRSTFTGQTNEWGQIYTIEVIIKAEDSMDTTITLDGLRISDSNIPSGSEVVSKTRLPESVIKEKDSTLDIQYSLSVPI